MSYESFVELYEKPRIPVVITGLQDSWKAQQLWNQADLSRRFGNHKFKVCSVKLHWAMLCEKYCSALYNTWLLIKLTLKGAVFFSLLFLPSVKSWAAD